jgi:endo-1,4-beta-xylanase
MSKDVSRRKFISNMGTAVAGIGVLPAKLPFARMIEDSKGFADMPETMTLRQHAAAKGLLYGSSSTQRNLYRDPSFAGVFAEQCNIMVSETDLKWFHVRPTPQTYDFGPGDWLVAYAQKNQIKFRGHSLVDHGGLPQWFDKYANASNAKQLMLDHITTVVSRYAGKVQSWDVINEEIYIEDKRDDGLRNSPWLKFIGPEYIEMAFYAAAAADPNAILVWNDNWLEEETAYGNSKRKFMLEQLRRLKSRNVPIHAIGIQSHLVGDHTNIGGTGFQEFLHEVSELGLKIFISELDVTDLNLPSDPSTRDQAIATVYYNYLSTVLRHKGVIAVLTWGLTDRYTWIAEARPRKDNSPVRPVPMDSSLNPKPAYYAIARAIDEAPDR